MGEIDFASLIGPVARRLWGEPSRQHSKPNELRWGTNGSKSVNLFKGVWHDHESNEGGGTLDLIKRETGHVDGEAVAWLSSQGFVNGHDASSLGEPAATYDYVDETGNLLFQVCRFVPKTFRQKRPSGSGWIWDLKGVRRVLYRLPILFEAISNKRPVLITEGEKDVDTLVRLSFAATTNPGGAGKWHSGYNEFLRDADVILIPDNDDTGRAHMQAVATELNGIAKSVRILALPGLPDKGDVSDWLASNEADRLRTLIAEAPQYAPAKPSPLSFRRHRDANNPTRKDLVKGLLPETGIGLLSGQSGTYKTFVALNLAGAVATGKPFAGYSIKRPGATFAFVSEGANGWPQRLDALSKHDHDNARLPIFYTGAPVCLLDAKSVAAAIETVKAAAEEAKRDLDLPLTLVLFDTVIGAAGFAKAGDENDSTIGQRVMAALTEIATQTGTFVLGVDHFGKAVETGTRGSSAKEAAADVVLALLANKSISGEISEQRLAVRKRRDGQGGVEHAFTVETVELGEDEDGEIIKSCAIAFSPIPTTPLPKESDGWTKSLLTLKRILMTLMADSGEDVLPFADSPEQVRAIKSEIVRKEFFKQHPADGAKDKEGAKRRAYNHTVRTAQNKGLIAVREIGEIEFLWFATKIA
jgi:AAA domain-containing protein